jgi:hypothetical protein
MSATVNWHNPQKTALRFTLNGTLRLDELRAARLAGDQLLDTVAHPVVVVFDFRDASALAMGTLGRLKPEVDQPHHPNTAHLMIYIGLNHLLTTLWAIVKRLYPQLYAGREIRFVHTLEEADILIEKYGAAPDSFAF